MELNFVITIIACAVYGIIVGALAVPISKKLILNRTDDPGEVIALNGKLNKIAIILASLLSSVAIGATSGMFTTETSQVNIIAYMVRNLLLLFPMLCIAITDSLIRKIPNSLLLSMIGIQLIYLTFYAITNGTATVFIKAGFGLFVGFVACTAPSILKIPVGAGDIKYSAVIGLCIYLSNYLQAMIIMGLLAVIAYIILKVTRKGGMKTLIPMGPFLSAGTVISICFPYIEYFIVSNQLLADLA